MTSGAPETPPAGNGVPVCTFCQSAEIRASRSSYPNDHVVLAGATGSFWRCHNCGARFFGPRAPDRKRHGRRHRHRRNQRDAMSDLIDLGRLARRWALPWVAILVTIIAVLYFLDRRGPQL